MKVIIMFRTAQLAEVKMKQHRGDIKASKYNNFILLFNNASHHIREKGKGEAYAIL